MNITFTITSDLGGIEKIIANCDSMPPNIVERFGGEVAKFAKGVAPVDTGMLRDTLQSSMVAQTTARIQSGVPYDIFQELGTYKMAPWPFLSPAIEMVASPFLSPSTWQQILFT